VIWGAGLIVRYLGVRMADFTPEQLASFRGQTFDAARQLAAFARQPTLMLTGYALFLLGAVALWPAFTTLARVIAARCPVLGLAGGTLLISSLFARAYFAGVDQFGFELVRALGHADATVTVLDHYVALSYGPGHVPVEAPPS
jgi:hypothetical protein